MGEKSRDIESIFSDALEMSTEDRSAYLDKVCGDDVRLRARIEALLKACEESEDFLEVPPIAPDVTADDCPLAERVGTVIGRYKLLEKIGEGGGDRYYGLFGCFDREQRGNLL